MIPLTYFLDGIRAGYGFPSRVRLPFAVGFALSPLYTGLTHWALVAAVPRSRRSGLLLKLSDDGARPGAAARARCRRPSSM